MASVHLTCPKCGGEFDYEYVPGASFTALRLGSSRYMRCPLCRHFSVFSMRGSPPMAGTPQAGDLPPEH
jgi:hypothetical protein